ncbi:DUF6245 family protein [Nocardia sp. NPDC047038]|uniref:DUF6245 family protein n=1 Tax=Nocardia sp. NPDC047038 TaxID=3154338 RepID=UPI00340C399F
MLRAGTPLRLMAQNREVGPIPLAATHAVTALHTLLGVIATSQSQVPVAVREFLTTVGLPTKRAQGISFTDVSMQAEHYLAVAADLDKDLFGVDLTSGRIDVISHVPDEPIQFVNSSLPLFVFSLGLYLRGVWEFLTAHPTEDSEPRIEATDRFLAVLAERDPAAVAEKSYFWPVMVAGILAE